MLACSFALPARLPRPQSTLWKLDARGSDPCFQIGIPEICCNITFSWGSVQLLRRVSGISLSHVPVQPQPSYPPHHTPLHFPSQEFGESERRPWNSWRPVLPLHLHPASTSVSTSASHLHYMAFLASSLHLSILHQVLAYICITRIAYPQIDLCVYPHVRLYLRLSPESPFTHISVYSNLSLLYIVSTSTSVSVLLHMYVYIYIYNT